MIRSLTGKITDLTEGTVTIEVRGIGYLVGTPTKTTTYTMDEELTLHTYLAVRENSMNLYGFTTQTELELFEFLLRVPKIGPKSGLGILNQASPTLLIESINKKDPVHLHKLSGIGKKTCENVVQYLQDKLEGMAFAADIKPTSSLNAVQTDAIDALVSLGYDITTARDVIKELPDDLSTNELITKALKQVS